MAQAGFSQVFLPFGQIWRLDSRSFVGQKRLNLAINKVWVLADEDDFPKSRLRKPRKR